MSLSPSSLVFLIQLTESEIDRLDKITTNESISADIRDESADSLVLASLAAGGLQDMYELIWEESSNLTPYDELLTRIHKQAQEK